MTVTRSQLVELLTDLPHQIAAVETDILETVHERLDLEFALKLAEREILGRSTATNDVGRKADVAAGTIREQQRIGECRMVEEQRRIQADMMKRQFSACKALAYLFADCEHLPGDQA